MSEKTARDWRPMSEDATHHTMGHWMQHDDGRVCARHARLGMWVFGAFPTAECLRDHGKEATR